MNSIIFIGSNPSQASDSCHAFDSDTKSWKTLTDWIDRVDISATSFDNISHIKTPKNRPLNQQEIRNGMSDLLPKLSRFTHVVALGKTASSALTKYGVRHLEMPHPSGCNRLLNDPAYVEVHVKKLKEYWDGPG
jgi:hypothetical protein